MNLVNEVTSDLALALLVEKRHSETLDSAAIVILMNRVTEVLRPLDDENRPDEAAVVKGREYFAFPN